MTQQPQATNPPSAQPAPKTSHPQHSLRPELLAPAGDADCIKAAIENGADAVYFGLDTGFNARARANNFSPAELPAVMAQLHRRGLKGYVTLNTLLFTSELETVQNLVRQIAAAGVDAVLMQDIGGVRLVRSICPDLPIHASTQMTLTSGETVRVAEELGIERAVLARELSIDEIKQIREATQLPIEVFVHGALCVAYSGQCLTSESLGGRSANRGQCAQACRLPYDLICDGKDVGPENAKYMLSPQDLAAYALIPDLMAAGVCSLKIEGRLKTPEYVANITQHYRRAINAAVEGHLVEFTKTDVEEMELSFSRGFSPGWLEGNDHKRLVPAQSSSKRGVYLGKVVDVYRGGIVVDLTGSIKRGDGVSFDCGRPVDDEQGGRVYEVFRGRQSIEGIVSSGRVELTFAHNAIDFHEIWPGQHVWKTDDPHLTARLRKTFSSPTPQRTQPLHISVIASEGEVLRLTATTENGLRVDLATEEPLAIAQKHPLSEEVLTQQFSRLGGSGYELAKLTAKIEGRPMVPFSTLGKLRHEMLTRLDTLSGQAPSRRIAQEDVLSQMRDHLWQRKFPKELSSEATTIHVLCRTLKQLEEVLAAGMKHLYADFQDIREYRQAVSLADGAGAQLYLATPRIQKPGEMGIFRLLEKQKPAGILVRNLSGLRHFTQLGMPVVVDFSLNCTNELTAEYLVDQGAQRITASYDLNRDQLLDLIRAIPTQVAEVVLHQHMPMFHMEHCVFCAMLSPGTNKTNCGRPCDEHEVKLRDRIGMEHTLKADVGCRNTLFNATPQSGAEIAGDLLRLGVRHFRLELLHDSKAGLQQLLKLYQQLLEGKISGKEVWTQLKASNRVGVTRGTLDEKRDPLAIL